MSIICIGEKNVISYLLERFRCLRLGSAPMAAVKPCITFEGGRAGPLLLFLCLRLGQDALVWVLRSEGLKSRPVWKLWGSRDQWEQLCSLQHQYCGCDRHADDDF